MTEVEAFINGFKLRVPEQAIIIEKVRRIYETLQTDISGRIIYGGVGFFLNGRHIGGVYPYTKHVSIVFSRGNELNDPEGLLGGNGKFRRHLQVAASDAFNETAVRFFAAQTVMLENTRDKR